MSNDVGYHDDYDAFYESDLMRVTRAKIEWLEARLAKLEKRLKKHVKEGRENDWI